MSIRYRKRRSHAYAMQRDMYHIEDTASTEAAMMEHEDKYITNLFFSRTKTLDTKR